MLHLHKFWEYEKNKKKTKNKNKRNNFLTLTDVYHSAQVQKKKKILTVNIS